MASGYDVAIKHVIERVTCAMNAIDVFDVCYSCYTVISAVC